MKLLLDQNISHKLVKWLADVYPDTRGTPACLGFPPTCLAIGIKLRR
jgi:hypothetical protein